MSCPDWRALSARRDAHAGDAPGWHAALEHFDGCPDCQRDAVAADPTLLFRRLPALEPGPGEVEAMKRAVAGMRRGERTRRRRPFQAGALRRPLLRAAALAAVLLGSVLLRGAGSPPPRSAEAVPAAGSSAAALDLRWMPLVEPIDPAYGSIIQVDDDDLSLVVVLPPVSDVDV